MRVNVNLKAFTVEDLIGRRKVTANASDCHEILPKSMHGKCLVSQILHLAMAKNLR